MKSLGQLAEKLWGKSSKAPPYLPIFLNWEDVVGVDLCVVTEPFKVSTFRGEQMLILQVDRAYSLEFQHQSTEFLMMVNNYIGIDYFSRIRVISM